MPLSHSILIPATCLFSATMIWMVGMADVPTGNTGGKKKKKRKPQSGDHIGTYHAEVIFSLIVNFRGSVFSMFAASLILSAQ